ncbi:MAG: YggS family pyridoxal phosphate-dependent enzyme [Planctomycetes bacterium]|nr:YggS family pyridoxal phosphate-dependent enzyme [Planctomycetota bacterium]MBI3834524.1 YggS family pyridoxal phosphate-dependent enzyme [Planctomycetota bacterium]
MRQKLQQNLKCVTDRIAEACAKARRSPSGITLVAVTKTVETDVIRELIELGVSNLGENRVQELTRRVAEIRDTQAPPHSRTVPMKSPRWHMVGHVQRNKVKALLPWIDVIHSVDSLRLAEEIDAEASRLGRKIELLLEVNASNEPQKQGVAFAAASHLAEQIDSLKHVQLRGLMCMGPLTDDQDLIRYVFCRVRELFDEMISGRICGPDFRDLSMGMSNDFEIGIECGATMLRIGTALFEGIPTRVPAAVDGNENRDSFLT